MTPKKIYINKKTADTIGDYSSITASIRPLPDKYHDEVEYTALSEVWHDASIAPNRPKDKSLILARVTSNKLDVCLLCVYPKKDWEKLRKHWYNSIIEWAYVEDLLPKEKEV